LRECACAMHAVTMSGNRQYTIECVSIVCVENVCLLW